MNLEILLIIHCIITGTSLFATAYFLLSGEDIDNIDNFWDWIVWNFFWELHLIKSIIKLFYNIIK